MGNHGSGSVQCRPLAWKQQNSPFCLIRPEMDLYSELCTMGNAVSAGPGKPRMHLALCSDLEMRLNLSMSRQALGSTAC